jgi:hypothetical protein
MNSFDTQGFAPTTNPRTLGKKAAEQLKRTPNAAAKQGSKAVTMGSEAVATVTPPPTAQDKKIKTLRGIQSKADMPFQMEFFGGIVGSVLAWIATKTGSLRARTIIKSITHAPVKALRNTTLSEFYKLPANYMKEVQGHARESAVLKVVEQEVPKATERTWNPVKMWQNNSKRKEAITEAVKKYEVEGALEGLTLSGSAAKAQSIAGTAATRAATLEKSGAEFGKEFYKNSGNIFTPVKDSIKTWLEKVDGTSVGRGIESLTSKLPEKEWLKGIRNKNVSGLASSLKNAGGKMSLFAAIIGVGVTAGIGATVLTARKESKEARDAIDGMAADIGDKNHPLIASITKAHTSQKGKRTLGHTMSVAGDVVNGALIAEVGGGTGGMPVFAASMALPMVGSMLVKDNPTLNAYANLKKADAGQIHFTPEEKVALVKQLVAVVPSVAAHGGEYNKLAAPVAEAIVAKNLSTRETMKLIANEAQFMALATEVADKQKADAAVVADAAPVAEKPAIKPMQHEAHHAAGKPQMAIHAKDAHHQGTVATQQKAVSA